MRVRGPSGISRLAFEDAAEDTATVPEIEETEEKIHSVCEAMMERRSKKINGTNVNRIPLRERIKTLPRGKESICFGVSITKGFQENVRGVFFSLLF